MDAEKLLTGLFVIVVVAFLVCIADLIDYEIRRAPAKLRPWKQPPPKQ